MGNLNVSTVGDYMGTTPKYDDRMRYGVAVQLDKSIFKKDNKNLNVGASFHGNLPSRAKAAIDLSYKQKLSNNFALGAGIEGSYSIQKRQGSARQTAVEKLTPEFAYGAMSYSEQGPYGLIGVDPEDPSISSTPENGEKIPEVGDVLDEVRVQEISKQAPNQRITLAGKAFVEYKPFEKVSFTAGAKFGPQYDIGGKEITNGANYKSVITSSKFEYAFEDTTAGEPPYSEVQVYNVSSDIKEEKQLSSENNNNNDRFKVGVYGGVDYKINDSLKIGVFGDTFHKEAGVKTTITF